MKFSIQWFERLPSTNTFLKELVGLKKQLPSGTVVAAREQTQGRGRREREWLSSEGENLTFSVLLRENCEPRKLPAAAMAAALAVAELLESEDINASLKWPNDVLVNGRKICGILSEGIPGGIIIGIGLNVNMRDAGHIDQPATSVLIETGSRRDVDELLEKLLKHLAIRLDEWVQGGFSKVRKNWEAKVPAFAPSFAKGFGGHGGTTAGGPNLGKTVTVRDGGAVRSGLLAGFGEDGELLLRDESGEISAVWAGDLSA